MNIYECGIMEKLVYPNTIREKACKSMALRGRIKAKNIQGGHIVKGVTERAGKLT